MFNRKHRKVRYVKCPYCGKSPVRIEGRSFTDKNKIVMHYECPNNHLTTGATNVYVLEKQSEEKQSEDTKKSSVSEFPPHDMGLRVGILPHDMGLRVELDTNGTYYLKSGWKEHCDWIYGLAWRYTDGSGIVSASRPDNPVPIAIMNSHVRLATSFDEHETGTTKQSEDTNMKETNR